MGMGMGMDMADWEEGTAGLQAGLPALLACLLNASAQSNAVC